MNSIMAYKLYYMKIKNTFKTYMVFIQMETPSSLHTLQSIYKEI